MENGAEHQRKKRDGRRLYHNSGCFHLGCRYFLWKCGTRPWENAQNRAIWCSDKNESQLRNSELQLSKLNRKKRRRRRKEERKEERGHCFFAFDGDALKGDEIPCRAYAHAQRERERERERDRDREGEEMGGRIGGEHFFWSIS